MQNIDNESLEKTRVFLITEYPYFAGMLAQCVFNWSETATKTAGVGFNADGNLSLVINPTFFNGLSELHRAGLLQHEILHLSNDHLNRWEGLDAKIANQAMDVAINQYIPAPLLPPGALMPATYQLPEGQNFEEYYCELMKRPKPPQDEPLDDHSTWENKPGEGDEKECALSDEAKRAIVKNAMDKAVSGCPPGSVPLHIQRQLETLEAKAKPVTWRQRLRQYIGRSLSQERESTRNRANRRLGLVAPGSKRIEAPKIMIAVDQSGSVSDDLMSLVRNELKSILEVCAEKTEVVFFDVQVAHSVTLDRWNKPVERYANGGTCFQAVIDYANKKRPDLLIMLTDGEDRVKVYPRYPILWGILGRGNGAHLKGSKLEIKG